MSEQTKRPRMSWRTWAELRDDLTAFAVQIAEEECVQYYLDDHADMIKAIKELCRLAREEFGPNATLTLAWRKVEGVPEGELVLTLRLPNYEGAKVFQRISVIHDVCEQQGYFDLSGSISLTTDSKPAR